MAYTVKWTNSFSDDYASAIRYLVEDVLALDVAKRLETKLHNAVDAIVDNPMMRPLSSKGVLREKGYREYFVMDYDIVYKVDGDVVVLARFLHQRRDIEALMG